MKKNKKAKGNEVFGHVYEFSGAVDLMKEVEGLDRSTEHASLNFILRKKSDEFGNEYFVFPSTSFANERCLSLQTENPRDFIVLLEAAAVKLAQILDKAEGAE